MSNAWADWLGEHGVARRGLSTKEDWRVYAEAPRRPPPAEPAETSCLDEVVLEDYNEARMVWNANPPTVRTPQVARALEVIEQVMASNYRDADRLRGSVVLDAEPALGKTTIALQYARTFHRRVIRRLGPRTVEGHQRVPVCYLSLSAGITLKGLNQKLLRFYGHPAAERHTRAELGSLAVDCVHACQTQLIVIDDLHFVDFAHRDGQAVADHLKGLASEMGASFIYVGVRLRERRFFDEGAIARGGSTAQTARRATRYEVVPFHLSSGAATRAWNDILTTFEDHLMLRRKTPGMLTRHASELHKRTQGHIGSLTNLIDRAAYLAIATGEETITTETLSDVVIDNAAESHQRTPA